MQKEDVQKALMSKTKPAEIVFKKANGELREMKCSTSSYHVPEAHKPKNDPDKPARTPNPEVCNVFDVEAVGWRSFRWDKLISVNGIDFVQEVEELTDGNQ